MPAAVPSSRAFALGSALVLSAPLVAQSTVWSELVANRWPGGSIAKVSEAQFEAFARGRTGSTADKVALRDAFLAAQYRVHGIASVPPRGPGYLVPSHGVAVATGPVPDAGVLEGPEPNGDPNGSPAGVPTAMGCGDQGDGTVFPLGDADWWQLTLAQAQSITVFTTPGAPGGVGPVDDTFLEVFDGAGNLLAANDDFPGRGAYSQLTVDVGAGTVYVCVTGFASVRQGTYGVDVLCADGSAPVTVVPEGPEPNGTTATATAAGCATLCTGDVATSGDSDWFAFTLASATQVTGQTGPGQVGSALVDTTLGLFDSNGTRLAFDDDGGGGLYSRIVQSLQPGTYYFDMRGFGSSTGTYELMIECEAAPPTLPEGPEPNNSAGNATPLGCDMSGAGNVATNGDSDWWSFVLTETTPVVGTTGPGAGTTIDDTTLGLFDSSGARLAFDDDGGTGLYSRIGLTLMPGTYYFDVRGFSTSTGTYVVNIECGSSQFVADFTTNSGGCAGSNGTPQLATRAGEVPLLGSTFAVDIVDAPASAPVFGLIGFDTTMTGGGVPLPLNLVVLGAPGCLLEMDPFASLATMADGNGTATLYLPIPTGPVLLGQQFFEQALVVDPGANSLGLTITNRGDGVVGNQ